MKLYRSIFGSGPSSDESPTLSKLRRKSTKMADQSNAEGVDLGNISLKDLFTQIDSMLGYNRDKYGKPEMKIQQDMKMTRTDKIEQAKKKEYKDGRSE